MLRVILVDDEPLARQGLRQLLAAHADVAIVGEADSVASAAELIHREKPDAVFLDIRMPRADGFELLNAIHPAPKTVFVTAYSDHAVRAFDFQAVDYLLKPVRPERLADAVLRLKAAVAQSPDEFIPLARTDRVICLRTPERTVVTPLKSIAALEAEGDFTRFHFTEVSPLLICRLLASYEKMLPSPPLARIGRSLIVNLENIARVEHGSRDAAELWLRGLSQPFTLGRRARLRLQELVA